MVNLNIVIPDDLHKSLKLESVNRDTTLKDLILEILEKEAKKINLKKNG